MSEIDQGMQYYIRRHSLLAYGHCSQTSYMAEIDQGMQYYCVILTIQACMLLSHTELNNFELSSTV